MRKKRSKMPFVYAAVVLVLLVSLYFLKYLNVSELYDKPVSDLNPATRELLKDPNYQNIILPGELDERIESGEPMFVYFFASTCSFCRETTPILMPIAEELGIDLPQFNLVEFQDYYRKYNIIYTPTLAYFEEGREVARIEGGIGSAGHSADDYREFLRNPKGASS
jgi:thiol-disulfide isomerase/thioredoxin